MDGLAGRDEVTFDDRGLVPAVVQGMESGEVLMVAWMNAHALRLTVETGQAHFWSRSRQCLWHKGATSGNFMNVVDIRVDCDGDTLLLLVEPEGPACHTGERSCFYRQLGPGSADSGTSAEDGCRGREERAGTPLERPGSEASILDELFSVIVDRKRAMPAGSYTSRLFEAGVDAILQKVGEEAVEVVLAAKGEEDGRVVSEIADLTYHVLVLLASLGLEPDDVVAELRRRRVAG